MDLYRQTVGYINSLRYPLGEYRFYATNVFPSRSTLSLGMQLRHATPRTNIGLNKTVRAIARTGVSGRGPPFAGNTISCYAPFGFAQESWMVLIRSAPKSV
jgi:hypothetical protein